MTNTNIKPLFVSHGSPMMVITPADPAHQFLKKLSSTFPKPKGIVCFSGHWETKVTTVTSSTKQIYDFYGFPSQLYEVTYKPAESVDLAKQVLDLLTQAGIPNQYDETRGNDHGTWTPLYLMYPDGDVPVVQVSLRKDLDPEFHMKLGKILSPLSKRGILILGSGSSTHNLRIMVRSSSGTAIEPIQEWENWLLEVVKQKNQERENGLKNWKKAPSAELAHPREEHLAPLFVAAGAGGVGERLHISFYITNLGTSTFSFDVLD
eukprot:TRINITY_DN9744_c0_g1_i1.p1 TRINITY_DN9744_c0_g1~~TRINITY_DN9744_c0_g1_i1.p1  ORF type:complete len:280 (-),score=60.34 TRINITY_DN9744_c0_g1_i1:122-910(-)